MKEIISNPDNIKIEELTAEKLINNYVFINNGKVLLKKHHNSYYFIHDEDLDKNYQGNLFLVKKNYELDYPLIGDKCLIKKCYYLVNDSINLNYAEWLRLEDVFRILDSQRYNNPRVQNITDELIEVLSYLIIN